MSGPLRVHIEERFQQDAELVVGRIYEAIGPAHGSKLGPPPRVTIVGEHPDGWRTEAPRQPATIIRRECAKNYREVD